METASSVMHCFYWYLLWVWRSQSLSFLCIWIFDLHF